jgi:hypothetical protein
MNRTRASESGLYAAAIEFARKIDTVASFIDNHHVLQHLPSRDCQEAQLADSLRRRSALSAYASEFSDCRFGSSTRNNRVNSDKPIDPGWLLPPNAWSRLKPYPRNTLPESSPVQVP